MKFANLQYIWFLLGIPLLIFFYLWAFKQKQRLIEQFVSAKLKDRLLTDFLPARQKIKATVLIAAFSFAVFALLGPRYGFHWEEVQRKGVDIIIALDVSKSMLAEDISPNRLERAKRKISDFLNMLQGDRVGLVAFAGTSFLQTPLTLDYGAVKIFLDDLDTDLIPVPGTALGEAITKSVKAFDQENKKSRVLIIITDGEDHLGNPLEIAKMASAQGVKIYTIGIGKEEGAPIPDKEHGGFKKDSSGNLILSKLDSSILQKIALETGGSYVRSVSGDLDLESVYKDINQKVEEKDLKSGKRQRFEERFQWFILMALSLLLFEVFISERKTKMFLLLILSFNVWAGSARDGESAYQKQNYNEAANHFLDAGINDPKNSNLQFNLGNSYYKNNELEKAQAAYGAAATQGDKVLEQKAYYNLGNTSYKMGKLPEAIEFYKKALELDPNDLDAKYNIEFTREELKRRIEENKKQQQNQQQNKDQKNQDQQKQDQQKQDQQKQDQQKQDQQKQDQQKQDQQKQDQQKQDQQKQDQQKQDQQKQDQQKQDQQKQDQQKQDQQKQDQQKQEQAEQAQAGTEKKAGEMSKEEAARWLKGMDENRKKYLKKKMQEQSGEYQTDKDW